MTKFLLDSGDPDEYRKIGALVKEHGSKLWGSTTNPSLIAKKLVHKKISQQEAFDLQRGIVLEILEIVPGAVSAEVYADEKTTAEEMITQGKEIASWHERVYVKLPTTIEGFKARTALRKESVPVNNTLVFSQEQSFAICLHEQIMQKQFGAKNRAWPTFISPFVGRLDDIGEDGMSLVEHAMKTKKLFERTPSGALWMLEASVRRPEHMKRGMIAGVEIMTVPAKALEEWFTLTDQQQEALDPTVYAKNLKPIPYWQPPDELLKIETIEDFMDALNAGVLDIRHELTEKGVARFANDWKTIIL